MRLTEKAIKSFKGNSRLKNRLALEMDKTVYTVDRWLTENEANGFLTTAKAVQIIKEETELVDGEILEEPEPVKIKAAS